MCQLFPLNSYVHQSVPMLMKLLLHSVFYGGLGVGVLYLTVILAALFAIG